MHRAAYYHHTSSATSPFTAQAPYAEANHCHINNTNAKDDRIDYSAGGYWQGPSVPSSPSDHARTFANRLLEAAMAVPGLHDGIYSILHDSSVTLGKFHCGVNTDTIFCTSLLSAIQVRTRMPAQLRRTSIKLYRESYRSPGSSLKNMHHLRRSMVNIVGDVRNQSSSRLYEGQRRQSMRFYHSYRTKQSIKPLNADLVYARLDGVLGVSARVVDNLNLKPRSEPLPPRPIFNQTPRLRTPYTGSMSFDETMWKLVAEMPTNTDVSGQIDGNGEGCAYSHGNSGNENKTNAEAQNGHSQNPYNQPNDRSNQSPQNSVDTAVHELLSASKSTHKDEPRDNIDIESRMDEVEEPHAPLEYQIPSDILHTALQAPSQTRASYWSQKLYRGPGGEELLLHYCLNMEVAERVAKYFLDEIVLGFDIEWKPFAPADSIKENAALIQIASENRIALFHIARFPGKTAEQLMPPTLKAILESPRILKAGVAVKGDCSRLEKYFPLHIQGVFELSRLYNLVEYYATDPSKVSNKLVKLATQVHQHLLLPLYKGEPLVDEPQNINSVRESDWSRPLDYEQIQYAAADAYAGFRLFDVLESKRKMLRPTPPIPRVCDYDNKPAPRSAPRVKRARKVKTETEKIVAQALSGLDADDVEEEAYEAAAEELAEEDEQERAESEFAAISSTEVGQFDTRFDPKDQDYGDSRRSAEVQIVPRTDAHHVGHVDLSKRSNDDLGNLKLAIIPSAHWDRPTKSAGQDGAASLATAEAPDHEHANPELQEAPSNIDLDPRSSEEPPKFATLIQQDTSPHSREYILATTWSQSYLDSTIPSPTSTSTPRVRATIPPLRAYHLWHHQRIPLDAVGAHLRSPPLAQSTVSSYIIQAITLEKLGYREADLVALMLTLPANLRLSRYGWLSRKLGIVR